MTKGRLYTVSLLLLLATAPWPFAAPDVGVVFGLPPWALYSLAMTAVYALAMGWFLNRFWALSASSESDGGPGSGAGERGDGER